MILPKTILVPTDFGPAADAALDHAIGLASLVDAAIILLHVFETPFVGYPDVTMGYAAELGKQIENDARATVEKLIGARGGTVPIRGRIEQGNAWRVILDVAEREGAGLIVIGTHGRTGLPRALIGSVAEKVVRMSPVPVLTVRSTS